jgi:hypothetical protein
VGLSQYELEEQRDVAQAACDLWERQISPADLSKVGVVSRNLSVLVLTMKTFLDIKRVARHVQFLVAAAV